MNDENWVICVLGLKYNSKEEDEYSPMRPVSFEEAMRLAIVSGLQRKTLQVSVLQHERPGSKSPLTYSPKSNSNGYMQRLQ